jgi:hypothetical protein
MDKSVSPDSAIIMQKPICFLCVYTQRLLKGFLSKVYNTFLKIKWSEMNSRPPKTLAKPYKSPLEFKKKKDKERGEKKRKGIEKLRKIREISIKT